MKENEKIIELMYSIGIDVETILRLTFSGYKHLKYNKQLYSNDVSIPDDLIKLYYSLNPEFGTFNNMKKAFVTRYINNELKLEGLNEDNLQGEAEKEGFKKMYEYIHSDDIDHLFDVYTLKTLHHELFSMSNYPEYAGDFRQVDFLFTESDKSICNFTRIREELEKLDPFVNKLFRLAPEVKRTRDADLLLDFLDDCVILSCKLLKIHPFMDGNGRVIRAFTNKLLEDAGLPPIYIKEQEQEEYNQAVLKASQEDDYTDIKNFYRYKVCDSIIELDINDRCEKNSLLEVSDDKESIRNYDEIQEYIKNKLLKYFDYIGVDVENIIRLAFSGYKLLKNRKQLYSSDVRIPETLISLYYSLNPGEITFDNMKKAFITKYVNNESKIEGVNDETIHGKLEIEGFKKMYEYIHSDEINKGFSPFTIMFIHQQLYSLSEFPEAGFKLRNQNVFLPGTGTDLCDYTYIPERLNALTDEVNNLRKMAVEVKNSNNVEYLLNYLDRCVVLNCKMILIHPFMDGNGRSVRGFINKLLEDAGLPPIYIKTNERTEYHQAMNLANNEGDYTSIKNFYRYKVCDSIIELDINDKLKVFNDLRGINNKSTDEKIKIKYINQ